MAKKKASAQPDVEAVCLFVMERGAHERFREYIGRGRRLQNFGADELENAFVKVFEILAYDPGHPIGRCFCDDIISEYEARSISPPYAAHPDLLEAYLAAMEDLVAGMTKAEKAEVDRRVWADYAAGQAALD